MGCVLNSLKVRTRFHSCFHLFDPWGSDSHASTSCLHLGFTLWVSPALVWPGCTTHLLGDCDLAPSPLSFLLCEVRGLASIISEAPSAPDVLRFCDPNAFEKRFSFVLSPHLRQKGLATLMFFLVFVYSWIFLRPFHPQLSSSLPAPMQSLALSSLCWRNRTGAAVWAEEGVSPEPRTGPPATSRFPLASWGLG